MKKLTRIAFSLLSLLASIEICLAASPKGANLPLSPMDPLLVAQQSALRERVKADYDHFKQNYDSAWRRKETAHDVLRYLRFSTGVLKYSVIAAGDIAEEILGVLRGALGDFPGLELEGAETNAGLLRDKEIIIRAFLATQIVQNLNIFGAYYTEDPQYEIEEPSLRMAMNPWQQNDHLDILKVISLAVREQLWNPRSTLQNLQDHVRDHWSGDLSWADLQRRDKIINHYITAELMGWIREMEGIFQVREDQKGMLRNFQEQHSHLTVTKINDLLLNRFVNVGDRLFHYRSSGQDNQCGFFSTFFHDRSDKRGLSARDEFFDRVSRHLENPFVANAFIDKVLDEGNKIGDMLGAVLANKPIEIQNSEFFKRLKVYEDQLKDKREYEALKIKALTDVVKILQNYPQEIKPYVRQRYSDEEADKKSLAVAQFKAKIRAPIRPLVHYLFKNLGAMPFRQDIDILREEFRKAFKENDRAANPGYKELTFRRVGSIIEPLGEGYFYSDPVDGLVIANQNVFPWMDGDTVRRTFFDVRRITFQRLGNFAQQLVKRLSMTQANLKRREQDLAQGLPQALENWIYSGIKEKDGGTVYEQVINSSINEWGLSKVRGPINIVRRNIGFLQQTLAWWQEQIPNLLGINPGIMTVNEHINQALEKKNINDFKMRLIAEFNNIAPSYDDQGQTGIAERVKQIEAAVGNLATATGNFKGGLAAENTVTEQLRSIVAQPEQKRQELAQRVYDAILRQQQGESLLIQAINNIINSGQEEREQIIKTLNLAPLLIEAAQVANYTEGLEDLLALVDIALSQAPVSLAIAERDGRSFYLVNAILATNPENKSQTARNTHLVNFGGGHYEKLIPESASSLTSVAKAERHLTKYNLRY